MNLSTKIISVIFALVSMNAYSAPLNPANFPPELFYAGKPIDPLCFFNMEGNNDQIKLTECGLQKEKYAAIGSNDYLTKQGFYGFDWKDTTASYPSQGSSYYKAWDAGNKQYWIYTANNGGGSGDFTSINLFTRTNSDTADLKTIEGGDRCNGGIEDVIEAKDGIQYSVNLTAYDFISLTQSNPHHLKAYDDLSACAACCTAKAIFTVTKTLTPRLQYIDLGTNKNSKNMSGQGTYQTCFNNLLASYVTQNKTKLDNNQLQEFVKTFNDTCIK